MDGHVITLARSSVEPFLQTAPDRDLREQAWRAWMSRGDQDNASNNHETIRQILSLRLEMANLLGYETFAHYRTAGTMAGTPDAALALMEEVWGPARERALEEQADIEARIQAAGLDHEVAPWDWRYYTEQVREERYDLDPSEVKAYLQLDKMIEAQFYVAERLFGVTFEERDDIPVYHPDVRVWEMKNEAGETVGLFYGDYFARPGKRGGAWMSSFRPQDGVSGEIPIIINNCNYNKPADGEPALLSFTDASTLFHEFGHGLHGLLSDTEYPSLAGTSVDRDFVEFPAQIYEHWLEQPEVLERFALHHETGEPMPAELLERVLEAQKFNQGFATVEFLNSGFVDMAYHLNTEPSSLDIEAFENEVLDSRDNVEAIPMRHRSTHFLHTFAGEGYSAGYYSYLWAGVLDNDGFAAFEEAGDIFDPELARKLDESVFSAGNSEPAMDAYAGFRGREPNVEPLLRNRGFIEAEG
ncbi:MAG: M3 family metallopeptidase [Oceanicaulis sp.]